MPTPDPRATLRAAGDRYKTARDELASAKTDLQPAMVAALRAGISQKDVIELSGYTRESVRTIARRNGIDG